ncbi:MAG TPA: metal ABC transporter substrate-binding protein [Acidimicrobiales bacterium]|nr:metal ABC transporter substrate-binding protein [Acidimicrobiales bacterium]
MAVTTSILADVVAEVVGPDVDVLTVMPPGADPHEFQASAREADEVRGADALVVNGGGFEEGLLDLVASVAEDGVPVHQVVADDGRGDADDHASEDEHAHDDAHFFTDPVLMAEAVQDIAAFLAAEVEGIDAAVLEQRADRLVEELEELDADVRAVLADVPESARVLVTGHDVLGPFAERYGFEVLGNVIPGGSTADGADAGELARLARLVRETGVPAIFVDESASDELARTLADEVGDVEVVPLHTEALGEEGSGAEDYVGLIRTNAERIAAALAPRAP